MGERGPGETPRGTYINERVAVNVDCFSLFVSVEPNFVFADVIRADQNSTDGEDDKVYFFFTEASVEYEFVGKLMIPRIARVCKVRHNFISLHQYTFKITSTEKYWIFDMLFRK